jgi:thiosulfate dehydrogenase [quinone] large subunit
MTPAWTSADYLLISNWIFAGFFHWIASQPVLLGIVDFTVIWGMIFIGLALFLGIFERFSALAGMFLLAMFWFANPPLTALDFGVPHEGNYLIVDKNLVEFFALLVLLLFPTGKHLGLAHLLKRNREIPLSEPTVTQPVSIKRNSIVREYDQQKTSGPFFFAPYTSGSALYKRKNGPL